MRREPTPPAAVTRLCDFESEGEEDALGRCGWCIQESWIDARAPWLAESSGSQGACIATSIRQTVEDDGQLLVRTLVTGIMYVMRDPGSPRWRL